MLENNEFEKSILPIRRKNNSSVYEYKLRDRRVAVEKDKDGHYSIITKRLAIISEDERKVINQSRGCLLESRPHSKYCIFYTKTKLSKEAMKCIVNAYKNLSHG